MAKDIEFEIQKLSGFFGDLDWNENSAPTPFSTDRSKFDVRQGSGSFFDNLGDKTIYDDFDLIVNLKF